MTYFLMLLALAALCFVQNMAFTWSSRSRNSGDPAYHRRAAIASNGVWFLAHAFLVKVVWEPLMSGDVWAVLIVGLVYTLSTTEGSVYMMRRMLKTESGKQRVGAR